MVVGRTTFEWYPFGHLGSGQYGVFAVSKDSQYLFVAYPWCWPRFRFFAHTDFYSL